MKIAIASGKGGTGKTSLSTNFASFLSKSSDVILADLDVEEPNSGLFIQGNLVNTEDKFKMVPEWVEDNCTYCGNCQKNCNFNAIIQLGKHISVFPQLCHSCFACSELCPTGSLPMITEKIGELRHFKNNTLNFIESRLMIGQEQAVPLIAQSVDYIENHFNNSAIVIFDAPPGTSCPVIETIKKVDFVILVTEPTPFGFHDLKLAIETVKKLKKKMGVVINRDGIGNDEVEKYCRKENIAILAKIKHDRNIAELYSKGELFYDKIPGIPAVFESIKQQVFELNQEGAR